MKINYASMEAVAEALSRMSTLTGMVGYAVMRTKDRLDPEYRIYSQMRANIIKKYAPAGKDGISPDDPGFEDFAKEYNEFLSTKVDVDVYQIAPGDYDLDKIYCENARAIDYEVVKALIVKKEDADAADGGAGAGDKG